MLAGPRIRATLFHHTFAVIARAAPEDLGVILAALPEEVQSALAERDAEPWVPAAWDAALVEATRSAIGKAGLQRVYRLSMFESMGGPLLGGLARLTQTLLGTTPGGFFAWSGRAWQHACRDCGELRLVSRGEREAVLELEGLPEPLSRPSYLDAVAASIEAVFDVCRVWGTVRAERTHEGARFLARWSRNAVPE